MPRNESLDNQACRPQAGRQSPALWTKTDGHGEFRGPKGGRCVRGPCKKKPCQGLLQNFTGARISLSCWAPGLPPPLLTPSYRGCRKSCTHPIYFTPHRNYNILWVLTGAGFPPSAVAPNEMWKMASSQDAVAISRGALPAQSRVRAYR